MSKLFDVIPYQYRDTTTASLGAGTGMLAGEFTSEYTTRLLALTGYTKAGAKTAVKVAIGSLLLGLSSKVRDPSWNMFAKIAAFGSIGSSILDWIAAYYPGGIVGLANTLAISSRVMSMGTRTVTQTLSRVERPVVVTARTATQTTRTVASAGRY